MSDPACGWCSNGTYCMEADDGLDNGSCSEEHFYHLSGDNDVCPSEDTSTDNDTINSANIDDDEKESEYNDGGNSVDAYVPTNDTSDEE